MPVWTNASADTAAVRIEIGMRALAAPQVISEEGQVRMTAAALGDITSWPSQPFSIAASEPGVGLGELAILHLVKRTQVGVPRQPRVRPEHRPEEESAGVHHARR